MDITIEQIESLGFIQMENENESNLIFNKTSNIQGWTDILVWDIISSKISFFQQSNELPDFVANGFPEGKDVYDFINTIFYGKMETMEELNEILIVE
jgi:hypothetical protein